MLIKVGDKVGTDFLSGIVTEIINGRKKGWRPTTYFEVKVTSRSNPGSRQIICLDEIKGAVCSKTSKPRTPS